MNKTGTIFNIQRFSIHDGPGIRTTVFMKGCPLACPWCSNPESIRPYPELLVHDIRCIGCFKCVESCPTGAITRVDSTRQLDRSKCDLCLKCAQVCPSGALEVTGKSFTVDQVMEELRKDRLFYLNSNGGITVSGGEPLVQAEFVAEVFRICHSESLHTALDTTGHAPWAEMERVLNYTDLVLYDIKNLDSARHREKTGCDNSLILENLRQTVEKVVTWIRLPLIPDFNDSESYNRELAEFIRGLPQGKIQKISILPYHTWGQQKYAKLGREYRFSGNFANPDEHMNNLKTILESTGIPVAIGS